MRYLIVQNCDELWYFVDEFLKLQEKTHQPVAIQKQVPSEAVKDKMYIEKMLIWEGYILIQQKNSWTNMLLLL